MSQSGQDRPEQPEPDEGGSIDARIFKLIWGLSVLAFMAVLVLKDVPLDVVLPFLSLLPKSRDFDDPAHRELPPSETR
jgi:hypothetical protein